MILFPLCVNHFIKAAFTERSEALGRAMSLSLRTKEFES